MDIPPFAPSGSASQSLRWFAIAFAAERALDFPLASITFVPLFVVREGPFVPWWALPGK